MHPSSPDQSRRRQWGKFGRFRLPLVATAILPANNAGEFTRNPILALTAALVFRLRSIHLTWVLFARPVQFVL